MDDPFSADPNDFGSVPLASPPSGIPREFKKFLKDGLGIGRSKIVQPSYYDMKALPGLEEYLELLGFNKSDPIFGFVPKDRDIRVANEADSREWMGRDVMGAGDKGLRDFAYSPEAKTDKSHYVHMRSSVEDMKRALEDTMDMKIERPIDAMQMHLYVLFHEVKHCGQEPGDRAKRETECDVNGIKAVEAQFPGSDIRDVVTNMRFVENGYKNAMMLDRAMTSGNIPNETERNRLWNAQVQTGGNDKSNPLVPQRTLREKFNLSGGHKKTPAPERIKNLQSELQTDPSGALADEAKQRTIGAYNFFSPKMTQNALASAPKSTMGFVKSKPAVTGPAQRG